MKKDPIMIYQFCLEVKAESGHKNAAVVGFNRRESVYEEVDLETGIPVVTPTHFSMDQNSYDEYVMLAAQGRHDRILEEILKSQRRTDRIVYT